MGNSEDKYKDDPYINQAQNNYAVRGMYTNSGLIPLNQRSDYGQATIKQITEQQEKIETTAFKNPIQIDRNSLKLEKNAYSHNEFYLTFEYTSDKTIYGNFYLNTNFTPLNNIFFNPSPSFQYNIIKLILPPGKNVKCQDQSLKIDMDYFLRNKIYDKNLTDLVIELFVLENNSQNVECILATFCKILSKPGTNLYDIKCLYQKCKVKNSQWYDLEDIYGLSSDENLCIICCANPKNTFFLPCKHSVACQDCAVLLRIKGNGCPICRQAISDSVILENVGQNQG